MLQLTSGTNGKTIRRRLIQLVLVLLEARFQGGDGPGEFGRVIGRRCRTDSCRLSQQVQDMDHLTLVVGHRRERLWERKVV